MFTCYQTGSQACYTQKRSGQVYGSLRVQSMELLWTWFKGHCSSFVGSTARVNARGPGIFRKLGCGARGRDRCVCFPVATSRFHCWLPEVFFQPWSIPPFAECLWPQGIWVFRPHLHHQPFCCSPRLTKFKVMKAKKDQKHKAVSQMCAFYSIQFFIVFTYQ